MEEEKEEATEEKETREWQVIRDECISKGQLDESCNLVAASRDLAKIEVVMKRLSCGCILVPLDVEEIII